MGGIADYPSVVCSIHLSGHALVALQRRTLNRSFVSLACQTMAEKERRSANCRWLIQWLASHRRVAGRLLQTKTRAKLGGWHAGVGLDARMWNGLTEYGRILIERLEWWRQLFSQVSKASHAVTA